MLLSQENDLLLFQDNKIIDPLWQENKRLFLLITDDVYLRSGALDSMHRRSLDRGSKQLPIIDQHIRLSCSRTYLYTCVHIKTLLS